ncbi:MAG: outer membrane beta-barrel protein [Thermoanaerobaculia bacterium]|nr:outer membrane beta-barrel protein [Thermoanaerobaculia bacterium]
MERPINNIDDLLNRRLHDVEVPPPPFVWPNVERALRRRKRRFFLWFLAAGLAGAGIWTVWSRPFTHTETAPATGQPARAIQPAKPAIPQAAIPAAPANEQAQQPITTKPALAPAFAPGKPKTTTQSINKGAGKYAQTPAATIRLPETATTTVVSAAANYQPESPGKTHPATAAAPSDLLIQNNALNPLPHPLAALEIRLREPEMPSAHPRVSKKKAAKKCYDFHANRQAWLIDAYAGPSLVRKSLDSGNPEYRDYIADRLQTERQEIGFNAGVRASYLFAENFMIRTGLHYDQFTEKFEYIDPNYIKYTVEIKQEWVNGQWITVMDTIKVEYGANYVKTYNRFGLLDIPLQAALELRNGPTGISLNLGGSVNILFWKRGSMLDLNGKPARFTPDKRQFDIFQPRVGLSLLGSVQWYYHLGPKTRVFAEPYYRHILEPVTRPGYPVKQSYGIGGIRFGLTKILDVN